MAATFIIKKNDTSPALRVIIEDKDGNPVPISGASVYFSLTNQDGEYLVDTQAAVINDGDAGDVQYNWQDGDVSEVGQLNGEFKVVFFDGRTERFPKNELPELNFITVIATQSN